MESQGLTSLALVGGGDFSPSQQWSGTFAEEQRRHLRGQSVRRMDADQRGSDRHGIPVVWKAAGTDYYSIWSTGPNGNQTGGSGIVSGAAMLLTSIEAGFNQDLNGDAVISNASPQAPSETAACLPTHRCRHRCDLECEQRERVVPFRCQRLAIIDRSKSSAGDSVAAAAAISGRWSAAPSRLGRDEGRSRRSVHRSFHHSLTRRAARGSCLANSLDG